MISYELAKRLKKAGFPLKRVIGAEEWNGEKVFFDGEKSKDGKKIGFLAPTLSELIDVTLKKDTNFRLHCYSHGFVIEASSQLEDMEICQSSEEAVASLYIKLNSDKIKEWNNKEKSTGTGEEIK